MELLLSVQNLDKHYGAKNLFSGLNFTIHHKDRIGMVGPNGSGKSTLLKIIYGLEPESNGKVVKKSGLKIAYVPQEESFSDLTVFQILMGTKSNLIEEYEYERLANEILETCGFKDINQKGNSLSGGFQKRLSFAKAWITKPDLILFDEPTNHLDFDTLFWLEETINNLDCSFLTVSHDRYFLENTCNKILEINKKYPKGCFLVDGNYHEYLERKEAFFESNAQFEQHLKSKLKKEIEWLRTSPKARTTKAESRIKEAYSLKAQYSMIKNQNKNSSLELSLEGSKRETQKLISIKNLEKSYGSRVLFKNLDITISPKTRLGILGFNGSGKTTLLKIIAKEISQDMGTIKYAEDLKIIYFKQNREIFEKTDTLRNVLSPNSDFVTFQGKPTHVNGFCKILGFEPSDLDMPCFKLSGGEKARALIGRLMLEKADVLLLDEPTNDLDIETLDIFLDVLRTYEGAILLISHDRFFLDSICTEMIGLGLEETPNFYTQFATFQEEALKKKKEKKFEQTITVQKNSTSNNQKEKKQLQIVINKITTLEKEIKTLSEEINTSQDLDKINSLYKEISKKQSLLDCLILDWEKLENYFNTNKL